MESERRRKVVNLKSIPKESGGFSELVNKWGNTVLTIFLIGALVWLGIRWRAVRAAQNRAAVLGDLTSARSLVQKLQVENPAAPASDLANFRAGVAAEAGDDISLVLNTSDDPKLKAEALIARGDLDWLLGNFPPLPGAATQPALRPPQLPDEYLTHAAEAYQQVLSTPAYAGQHDAIVSAHFGLAAIAENRHQWEQARQQLQAAIDDADAPAPLKDSAQTQLSKMSTLQTPLYLSPATQPAGPVEALGPAAPARAATMPGSAWKMGLPQPLGKPPALVQPTTRPAAASTQPAR